MKDGKEYSVGIASLDGDIIWINAHLTISEIDKLSKWWDKNLTNDIISTTVITDVDGSVFIFRSDEIHHIMIMPV